MSPWIKAYRLLYHYYFYYMFSSCVGIQGLAASEDVVYAVRRRPSKADPKWDCLVYGGYPSELCNGALFDMLALFHLYRCDTPSCRWINIKTLIMEVLTQKEMQQCINNGRDRKLIDLSVNNSFNTLSGHNSLMPMFWLVSEKPNIWHVCNSFTDYWLRHQLSTYSVFSEYWWIN